ncbi:30S ribosomal protein S12 methylthiotransferase RimO [Auraticoccus sp. F435]|uniref:Ribosomal protein uS12 methylthiotransferase RimO n=1 Tax=Auraticoccus cholistanensis TaxID=2656650 RepID=A0A6A9UVR6_9ACTN|nr:30S ribosomal protein S12 methylthiotransferase RimO [Auraticoccus cholistanensis]MVA75654.1 30S ribosomal protein S12 methylthiotransferase RimO [Auraticoccus cholistanensis]
MTTRTEPERPPTQPTQPTTVHLVSLGCARNDVDSEELAARLEAGGFRLVDDPEQAEAVMVNTCGFVESAKKDSVDTLLAAADLKESGQARAVVAVGCLAERYGRDLAESLPEADAVLGFDDYADVAARLQDVLAGGRHVAHAPRDRRRLLPITPVQRQEAAASVALPGHGAAPDLPAGVAPASGPRALRRRLGSGPMAPLKIASGCDRRCTFCAIPAFRGAYVSRPPADVLAEARWLAGQGVRELFLVSENSSSYGKDLGDIRLMEGLLGELAAVDGIDWVRVSYLQPAETRASLVAAMTSVEGVVPYFDLSFQHAAPAVLRRMRRFGDPDSFLGLVESVRERAPHAGIRSNVIVGFPGETEQDLQTLLDFLTAARLDAVGVFPYSDEDGTAATGLDGHLPEEVVEERRAAAVDLVTELMDQRAEDRIGERVQVLVESDDTDDPDEPAWTGRSAHQGPEVDGVTRLVERDGRPPAGVGVGDLVTAVVRANEGPDLLAEVVR